MLTIFTVFIIIIVTRQRTRINRTYGLNRYCSNVIERNLQLTCIEYLRNKFETNPTKISKKRRASILSNLLFSVDGTIRDFLPQPTPKLPTPPPSLPAQPEIQDVEEVEAVEDSPQPPPKLQTLPPAQPEIQDMGEVEDSTDSTTDEPSTKYINPFQQVTGGFRLYGRRRLARLAGLLL